VLPFDGAVTGCFLILSLNRLQVVCIFVLVCVDLFGFVRVIEELLL